MSKVLFILKRKDNYNHVRDGHHVGLSTGLYNSASFVSDMLNDMGIDSAMEVAVDNNCIDRLVSKHKPQIVIIEALWVVPQKFEVLQKLHPNVRWILRLHSEMPFMAGEGMAMNWIGEYSKIRNMIISVNAPRMLREIKVFLKAMHHWTDKQVNKKVVYLPNFYPQDYAKPKKIDHSNHFIDIGCFGAIRPLKNHMVQAVAAVDFAEKLGKRVRFHINSGRVEMKGQPVAHNLEHFFAHLYDRGHRLVNHAWAPREDFLKICAQMDIGMQCNFSETFNIVGADLISKGVPLIGTSEIPWLATGKADPTNGADIAHALEHTYHFPWLNVKRNQWALTKYTKKTSKIWKSVFKKLGA